MATRLHIRVLLAPFVRSYGEGHEVLLLRPRATAAAGWSAVAVAHVALVVVHSRFTYVKHPLAPLIARLV
jgi:hypothetical protein